ncbi:hypothetical protein MTBBW1_2170008 [Desulfamplus magnetovallimortis]|uniref:Uncharacterized protein n=1 Tax=Desulfamplus magnetovallimortis TaxID=1246637 RepID=A0A1W1HCM6_9BACT|nr:hypothetical protein MTBBW1_2170008 [Desulfamplus magnetovallimortis]
MICPFLGKRSHKSVKYFWDDMKDARIDIDFYILGGLTSIHDSLSWK